MQGPVVRTNELGFRREISHVHIDVPHGACDSHMHIVGPRDRYPLTAVRSLSPPPASWDEYRETAAKLGLDRCVIVQPSFYGTDNRCTLDAIAQSQGRARGVVVVEPGVDRAEIERMHAIGVRGIRVQIISKGGIGFDSIEPIADLIAPFGWHLQLYLDAEDLLPLADRLRRLAVPVVFDHMAHVIPSNGIEGRGFALLLELLAEGRAWVKLSNALFPPSKERARRLAESHPTRVLWGSDWPHVAHSDAGVPDDGALLNELAEWIPDPAGRALALADNPDALYFKS